MMTTETTEKKSTLFSDETFDLLRKAQKQITDATGYSPDFSKLINDIVTQETINQSTERFIEKLSCIQ